MVLPLVAPKMMIEGNWRRPRFDADTTDEQMQGLTSTPALRWADGGLAPLIGEFLGTERADIALESGGDGWTPRVGGQPRRQCGPRPDRRRRDPDVDRGASCRSDADGTPSPAVRLSLFGIDFGGESRSGFTAPFSWAA
jgi:hypothetical protein